MDKLTKKAVQFGAGNIGRGFIGALLSESGYRVVFADINAEIIEALQVKESYTIHILDVHSDTQIIKNFTGVLSNTRQILEEIAEAEIITTAVGAPVLPVIARTIAEGIEKRRELAIEVPLNIIACENMVRASSSLKEAVYGYLTKDGKEYAGRLIGFPNSSVDRIVPPFNAAEKGADPLDVGVESFYEWIVEEPEFKGEVPCIKGMKLTDNLVAYVQRKLFTLNCGHAITAYLGFLAGKETIGESIRDHAIAHQVKKAMGQSGGALCKVYGFNPEEHAAYIEKIIERFKNPYIKDEVSRVGRDPLRKLGAHDRIIAPLHICYELGLPYDALIEGAAAALHYRNDEDKSAVQMHQIIEENGISVGVARITGLVEGSELHKELLAAYQKIA